MSWLNLNDSLNNLKGQISNFASNVLADESTENTKFSEDFDELRKLCASQQEEIKKLKTGSTLLTNSTGDRGYIPKTENWPWWSTK